MKKAFFISIAAIIFISSMSNAVLFLGFKLNQAEIERVYCVNKAKPKKQCHGKCHLKQQLAENNTKDEQPSPFSNFEKSIKINFFHQQLQQIFPALVGDVQLLKPSYCAMFTARLFGKSLFQPPDNQPVS